MTEPRSLEEICEYVNFSMQVLDMTYCSLKPTQRIRCVYRDQEKDHNGMYQCLNPLYVVSGEFRRLNDQGGTP